MIMCCTLKPSNNKKQKNKTDNVIILRKWEEKQTACQLSSVLQRNLIRVRFWHHSTIQNLFKFYLLKKKKSFITDETEDTCSKGTSLLEQILGTGRKDKNNKKNPGICFKMHPWFHVQFLHFILLVKDNQTACTQCVLLAHNVFYLHTIGSTCTQCVLVHPSCMYHLYIMQQLAHPYPPSSRKRPKSQGRCPASCDMWWSFGESHQPLLM